ncbi:aspartate/glutamate racemase family protein [Sporomusa termitida]|uniref:Racemase YgeA n=1 Tax=Sporomusa termitida TaxID=2377 RepID=A0A517E0Q1_9FIRM|nr:amino acid racemase [Sporomusa termitida]QDR83185.1 Putative racemase YgeA [Sporomusa termitida]
MKKAGIIGGIGPASTLDYYSGIIEGYRAARQDGQYPGLVIDSINMTEMLGYVAGENWDGLIAMLLAAVKNVKNAGADVAAIASNTPHIVFDQLQEQSPVPLISIVEATCQYVRETGCTRVIVMGTKFTMTNGLYTEKFRQYGLQAFVPDEQEKEAIHNIIFPKLEDGIVVPEDKKKLLGIAEKLITKHHANGLVLGCTELPLMVHAGDLPIEILNTAQIHVRSIVKYMLA